MHLLCAEKNTVNWIRLFAQANHSARSGLLLRRFWEGALNNSIKEGNLLDRYANLSKLFVVANDICMHCKSSKYYDCRHSRKCTILTSLMIKVTPIIKDIDMFLQMQIFRLRPRSCAERVRIDWTSQATEIKSTSSFFYSKPKTVDP